MLYIKPHLNSCVTDDETLQKLYYTFKKQITAERNQGCEWDLK